MGCVCFLLLFGGAGGIVSSVCGILCVSVCCCFVLGFLGFYLFILTMVLNMTYI